MSDENLSLLEWLKQKWITPLWQRTIRLLAAGLLAVFGAVSLFLAPETGNGFLLIAASILLLVWGLRISVPEEPLPVLLEEEPTSGGGKTAAPAAAFEERAGLAMPSPAQGIGGVSAALRMIRIPLAVGFALWAQRVMDVYPAGMSADSAKQMGWILYAAAFFLAAWALLAGDASLALTTTAGSGVAVGITRQRILLLIGAVGFGLLAYAGFWGGMFRLVPLIFLGFSLLYWLLALLQYSDGVFTLIKTAVASLAELLRRVGTALRGGFVVSSWSLLVLACFIALVFYRTYGLGSVPPEMTSDHAEKLINVIDVLEGRTLIFFANNGGREPLEMYLVALVSQLAGTGISFLSLKIVSVAVGIATLPFLYLLGKELADRRVGLLAMILGGVGYWPDMISHLGLRLPLAMLFSAATLYFFLRALRRRQWNDFLWAGILLGIGMYGYTPIRIVPVALAAATGLFLLHPSSKGSRLWSVAGFVVTMLTTILLFVPFIRYAVDFPGEFWLRTVTRIIPEQGEVLNPFSVFWENVWNALQMFGWNDGVGWFNCVPLRPALDIVTGALFHLGALWMFVFFLKKRFWESLFLLVSLPILLLPSIMALAEPVSNPSLARTVAAVPVVFLFPAFGFIVLLDSLRGIISGRSGWAAGVAAVAILLGLATAQDFDLTQGIYPQVFRANSENASELGAFIHEFARSVGRYEDAHLVPYPYWVDDRLVNLYAGVPIKYSFVVWQKDIASFEFSGRPTLFLLLAQDAEGLQELQRAFPDGYWSVVPSASPGHDFIYYLVPGEARQAVQP